MPAAGSDAHTAFIAAVQTLYRSRFDEAVAKHVKKKCFGDKHMRFSGTESDVATVFTRLVATLKEAFIVQDAAFNSLFNRTDAAATVRVEANTLQISTLELLVGPDSTVADWLEGSALDSPQDGKRVLLEFARRLLHAGNPFQVTSAMLSVRVLANHDSQDSIANFNAAHIAARRICTLDIEDVKELFPRPHLLSRRCVAPHAHDSAICLRMSR
ncbi:hypothetical protein CYMTET_52855 [Cymbomonas tetramitiformis]|uniref:Uncharacterized protein n=1 Tax=Cymbomonas tetramitiformis TaxID=36881 RepID=A0AAE0ESB3_9CHLO|nr:hypothetical protein CYMTET_52855 [Cymbomonas tetramitiformis]